MKWKTQRGQVIEMSDMTEAHLRNAARYCAKREKWWDAREVVAELNRRLEKAFTSKGVECPFCKHAGVYSPMLPRKHVIEAPIDVGFSFDEIVWRYHCSTCDASSGKIDGPKLARVEDFESSEVAG